MKKYFMKGVDEPLEFGDTLGFDLEKNGEDGKSIKRHIDCTFIPEIVELLLAEDIIEEKEVEEEPKPTIEDGPSEEEEGTYDDLVESFNEYQTFTTGILKSLIERVEILERKENKKFSNVCKCGITVPDTKNFDIFGFVFQ